MQKTTMSIGRQIQFVFAISIIILIISSAASYYSNQKLIESSKWVNHTNEVILNTEKLNLTLKNAEAAQRGYLLTLDTLFLQPYYGSHDTAMAIYAKLKALTIDNELQQKNLLNAKVLIDSRFRQMDKVLALEKTMLVQERSAISREAYMQMVEGRRIMEDLVLATNIINTEEQRLLKLRTEEQETFIRYTPVLVVIAALLAIIISLIAYSRIKNDLSRRIQKQKEDEDKYAETSRRISVMKNVTQDIAAGNFDVRSNDELKDELGSISVALNDMAKSLGENFTVLEKQNWLQSGTMKVSESMRGERNVKTLADKILASIVSHVNAYVATLYIADRDHNLTLKGSYATTNAPENIEAGQGLISQAIQQKQVIVFSDLPENYLTIASSIGNGKSVHSTIIPLIYNNIVIAVIELGTIERPDADAIEFIHANTEAISIGINGVLNLEKLQELLEETQAQSEELQMQHNELENMNTELEAQTQKLQASEEELKVQQEELQEANGELQERARLLEERNQQIAERNLQVQKKAEELEISTRYKSEFLANMSHELRTPLNSILLLSRLLSENSDKNLNDEQVEYATVIRSSGNGLLALIDDILDLSRIEAGKMDLEYERVFVKDIAANMKAIFEPMAKDKGLSFIIEQSANIPASIETDKMRLDQVIKNLISNALKFTEQGSVTLSIAKDEHENAVNITVKDTGIGIAQDKQQAIFEAFQQADGSTRRKYGGTGLGLSISRQLITLLGGTLKLQSEPGKGSSFIITIPLSKQNIILQDDQSEAEQVVAQLSVSKINDADKYHSVTIPLNIPDDRANISDAEKLILIIEDDTAFAKSLLDYTHKKGYKGIVAVRGDEGIELAKKHKPTGILLDIQLPIKSGWEVMEELKNDASTRHIPVHIMSSHEVKKESLVKGAIDFINKPVAFEQLQQVFQKLEHVLNKTTKKVLIVEENSKHAKALAYFLETFAINAEIKNNIHDGVDALKTEVDCVILDMGIPDHRSYEMLEEVKKQQGLEQVPIIIFTGKSLSMTEEQRIKKYADSIVVKTAHSYQRILDEVSLFLHLVEANKVKPQPPGMHRKLGALNEVLNNKTVLVVDDDVRNIFSLTKALEKFNIKVITALNGKEALQKLEQDKDIDIVLLDMMMPEMDGYETAKRIRQNNSWRNLPVIAVTAKAMTGDREKCITAGASDYITKPVDIDQLLSLLRVWLYEK